LFEYLIGEIEDDAAFLLLSRRELLGAFLLIGIGVRELFKRLSSICAGLSWLSLGCGDIPIKFERCCSF